MMCVETNRKDQKENKITIVCFTRVRILFLHEFKCLNENELCDAIDSLPCLVLLF